MKMKMRIDWKSAIKMNFFEDAVRFFSNMKKEASAKHILIKGAGATEKLNILKAELVGVEDLSAAFSELASKVFTFSDLRNASSWSSAGSNVFSFELFPFLLQHEYLSVIPYA